MRGHSRKNLLPPPTLLSVVVYLYQQQRICPLVQFLFDVMTWVELWKWYLQKERIWKMCQKANLMYMARTPDINHSLNEKPRYFNKVELSPCHYLPCSKWKHGAVTNRGSVRLITTFSLEKQSALKSISMMPSTKSRCPFMM